MRSSSSAYSAIPIDSLWKMYPDTMGPVLSRGSWTPYRHLVHVSRRIAVGVAKEGYRGIVCMPPGSGKSWLISWLLPTWYLELHPKNNILELGYNKEHVSEFGEMVRDQFDDPRLSVKLDSKAKSKTKFKTLLGGRYWGFGVGGGITGKHSNLIVIDDPIKNWDEALSENHQEKLKNWFNAVVYSRRRKNASIILLHTRWHENDLAGYLENEQGDKWDMINLPLSAEEGDPLGRKLGETLCADIWPQKEVDHLKAITPPMIFDGLYQQHPSSLAGNIFHREWWRFWSVLPPRFDEEIITADLNFEEGEDNDFVVFQHWAREGANAYLLDQVRGQWSFVDSLEEFKRFCAKHPRAVLKLIENKANGAALVSMTRKKIMGVRAWEPYGADNKKRGEKRERNKTARAVSISPVVSAGQVWLPADDGAYPFVKGFINEHANFPKGKHDDQVDAEVMALVYFYNKISGSTFGALSKM